MLALVYMRYILIYIYGIPTILGSVSHERTSPIRNMLGHKLLQHPYITRSTRPRQSLEPPTPIFVQAPPHDEHAGWAIVRGIPTLLLDRSKLLSPGISTTKAHSWHNDLHRHDSARHTTKRVDIFEWTRSGCVSPGGVARYGRSTYTRFPYLSSCEITSGPKHCYCNSNFVTAVSCVESNTAGNKYVSEIVCTSTSPTSARCMFGYPISYVLI